MRSLELYMRSDVIKYDVRLYFFLHLFVNYKTFIYLCTL